MNKRAMWAEALIFLAFIGVFFVLNLVLPDRQFSEQENRNLQTLSLIHILISVKNVREAIAAALG